LRDGTPGRTSPRQQRQRQQRRAEDGAESEHAVRTGAGRQNFSASSTSITGMSSMMR
jgi:hypothetical protein